MAQALQLHTWRHRQELLLHSFDQVFDLLSGSTPKHQTLSWVDISRLDGRVAESCQNGIDVDACEASIEHFGLLLRVPSRAVKTIFGLHLSLRRLVSSETQDHSGCHTGSSSHAAIKASYGLLKADVEMPLRSSKVLFVGTAILVVAVVDVRTTQCRTASIYLYLCTLVR
jgi:hypothetical protein